MFPDKRRFPVPDEASPNLKSARRKAEQLDVSVKTLDRWAKTGIISPPIKIQNRKYWAADEQPRRDGNGGEAA
jgi:predicted site-specific integrase-resolvase